MLSGRQCILAGSLALLLTACGVSDSAAAVSVPTALPPTASQPTASQHTTPSAASNRSGALQPTGAPTMDIISDAPPKSCPVTRPQDPRFVPPPPYPPYGPSPDEFWYGSDSLWTAVRKNGVWSNLPHNPDGYTQKVFWWREGYSWTEEPEPQLVVTGWRLDAIAAPLTGSRATNAFAEDILSAMLVGVDLPTLGCWEITGHYAGTELSFVVWVGP